MTTPATLLRAGRLGAVAVAALVALAAPLFIEGAYDRGLLNQALIYALLVLGFNFTLGYTGQISLGHVGFWAIGAYSSALLTTEGGWSPLPAAGIGVVLACVAASVLAVATSRLRTHYLALATLGFGEIVRLVLQNWREVTNGTNGVVGTPPLASFIDSDVDVYYALLAFTAIGALVAWRFQTTRYGRTFLAVKQGELAAESTGIPTTWVKAFALVVSAIYAAVAGSLYAHVNSYIGPEDFVFPVMVTVLTMLIVGGQGTVSGPLLGAVVLTLLPERLRDVGEWYQLAYGVVLLAMVVWMPYGIVGLVIRTARRLVRRRQVAPSGRFGDELGGEAEDDLVLRPVETGR